MMSRRFLRAALRATNVLVFAIQQTIVIRYQGTEYVAWLHGKSSYDANTELDGHPLHLVCELTRQPDYEGKHYGICKAV
jgi:hypothetical protein